MTGHGLREAADCAAGAALRAAAEFGMVPAATWLGGGNGGPMGGMEVGMIQHDSTKSQGRRSSAFGFEMGLSQTYEIYSQDLAMNKM